MEMRDAVRAEPQGVAHHVLGAAIAILRGGVEIADAGIERGADGGAGLLVGDFGEDAGKGGAAEAEFGQLEAGPTDLALLETGGAHLAVLPGLNGGGH